jgi:hypothetical protein
MLTSAAGCGCGVVYGAPEAHGCDALNPVSTREHEADLGPADRGAAGAVR